MGDFTLRAVILPKHLRSEAGGGPCRSGRPIAKCVLLEHIPIDMRIRLETLMAQSQSDGALALGSWKMPADSDGSG